MASSLVDDLVCSVCLALFQDPHMLDCSHNFCLACLKGCADGRGRGICPECRWPFRLRDLRPGASLGRGGRGGTPPVTGRHRILANLAEKARKLQLDDEPPASATSAGFCEEHEEPLKLFCWQDRVPICVICRDMPRHRGHNILPTKDAVKEAQRKLKPYLKPLKRLLEMGTEEKLDQQGKMEELESCTEDIADHISTGFASLHRILHEKEKAIKKTAQEKRKKNLEEMQAALSCLKNNISSLTEIIARVKAALESTDHVAFLKDFRELMERAKDSIEEEEEEKEDDNSASEEEDWESRGRSTQHLTYRLQDLLEDDSSASEEEDQEYEEEQGESSEEEEEHSGGDEKNVVPVFPSLKKFKVALDFEAWGKLLQGIEPREVN